MSNTVINRIKYRILDVTSYLRLSSNDDLYFSKEQSYIFKQLKNYQPAQPFLSIIENGDNNGDNNGDASKESKVSFDFYPSQQDNNFAIDVNEIKYFRKFLVKKTLIEFFQRQSFLIEPFPTAADLSIYKIKSQYNSQWDVYERYDLVIYYNEISISIGSTDTLISKSGQGNIPLHSRAIDSDGLIKREKFLLKRENVRVLANAQQRRSLGVRNKIAKTFFQEQYNLINKLYQTLLTADEHWLLRFESGGFKTVHPSDIGQVDFDKNLMLFGKQHTDVNAASGMRDGGPFEIPKERAERVKFLFIYENSEQANNLYLYLKKGLKHFPGLLSYIGIPFNVANERLQYTQSSTLRQEFDSFLQNTLTNDLYNDYFAIVLLPFSKESATDEESVTYFHIKEKLLTKGIVSQDISSDRINSGSFHFHLPNIAIAILAKIGGVPWKLQRKQYNELIVGFNEDKVGENQIVGTAVYFDNSGKLKEVKSFHSEVRDSLIVSLKNSINQYLLANENNPPERLVIHYYKPPKYKDVDSIHYLIRNEFRFNLPFALVEINDSKVSTDICFDVDYQYGMPVSGTYVKLGKANEYLLFNNLRYWKNPVKTVSNEEYPIKIKLYNTESGGFTHRELISQVYEFSRLYWKGLKQKSQPVTTQYSKMVAQFAIRFDAGNIPINPNTQNTAWFI